MNELWSRISFFFEFFKVTMLVFQIRLENHQKRMKSKEEIIKKKYRIPLMALETKTNNTHIAK